MPVLPGHDSLPALQSHQFPGAPGNALAILGVFLLETALKSSSRMGAGKAARGCKPCAKICETKADDRGLHGGAQLLWGSGQWLEMWHG